MTSRPPLRDLALLDAQATARLLPGVLHVPSLRQLERIRRGDHVRLGLRPRVGNGYEPLWSTVQRRDGDALEVLVAQDSSAFPTVRAGVVVQIGAQHVLEIVPRSWMLPASALLVLARVVGPERLLRLLERGLRRRRGRVADGGS